MSAAYEVAEDIAAKSPTIIRRAKESLNGIDPVDVRLSYRLEQGFTYEIRDTGVADEQRAAFVEKTRRRHHPMTADTHARRPGGQPGPGQGGTAHG